MKLEAVVLFVSLMSGLAGCGDPQTPVPAAPSELRGAPMGSGLHLYWKDNSEDEDEFVVESRVDEGAFTELARVPFNTTQYMVSSGQQDRRYSFRVVARGAAESSNPSNEITWTP